MTKLKNVLFIFVFTFLSFHSFGQVPKEVNYWLYNLPFFEAPNKVLEMIKKDNHFLITKISSDTSMYYSLLGDFCFGRIIKPDLPADLNKIDSSFFELITVVSSEIYKRNNKRSIIPRKSRFISRSLKILRLEYFSSDTLVINKYFDLAVKQLGQNIDKKFFTRYTYNSEEKSEGNEIIYFKNRKHLKQIELLKKTYSNQTKSFCIEFCVSVN